MKKTEKHNALERVTFICGIIIITALVGFLIFGMVKDKKDPALLEISTRYDPDVKPNGYHVSVFNAGDETSANTIIMLGLYRDGKNISKADIHFDYVSPKSNKGGWVVFYTPHTNADSISVESVSYLRP